MSPVRPDAPLRKVTLNLYEADCQLMERWHGHGWTTRIREIIHSRCIEVNSLPTGPTPVRRTLGDLADD